MRAKTPWILSGLLAIALAVATVFAVWPAVGDAPWAEVSAEPTQPPPTPTPALCPTAPDIQSTIAQNEANFRQSGLAERLTPEEYVNFLNEARKMTTDALQPRVDAIRRMQLAGECRPARTQEDLRELCSIGDSLACQRLTEEKP
jgi:hypothetical protein